MTHSVQDSTRDPIAKVGFARPRRSASQLDQLRCLQLLMTAGLAVSTVVAATVISIGLAKADGINGTTGSAAASPATPDLLSAAGSLLPLLALIAGCTMVAVGASVILRARRSRAMRKGNDRRPGMTFV
jgi:hypothetical protein